MVVAVVAAATIVDVVAAWTPAGGPNFGGIHAELQTELSLDVGVYVSLGTGTPKMLRLASRRTTNSTLVNLESMITWLIQA